MAAFVILAAILLYYGFLTARINTRISGFCLARLAPSPRHSKLEITAALRLGVSGLLQAGFLILLVASIGLRWRDVLGAVPRPELVLYGVLLGIGEMALSSFLCNVGMQTATAFASPANDSPSGKEGWFALSKGGWMRSYLKAIQIAPAPLAAAMVVLYVAGEEAMFRGVLIHVVRPFGDGWALAVSTLFFALAQTFNMPNWRSALFPVIGATVMGIVHGALFLAVPSLLPLIIAHLVLFVYAAL